LKSPKQTPSVNVINSDVKLVVVRPASESQLATAIYKTGDQPRISAANVALPAFAAERRAGAPLLHAGRQRPQLSIDIFRPRGVQQQTRRTPLLSIDGTDGRM